MSKIRFINTESKWSTITVVFQTHPPRSRFTQELANQKFRTKDQKNPTLAFKITTWVKFQKHIAIVHSKFKIITHWITKRVVQTKPVDCLARTQTQHSIKKSMHIFKNSQHFSKAFRNWAQEQFTSVYWHNSCNWIVLLTLYFSSKMLRIAVKRNSSLSQILQIVC